MAVQTAEKMTEAHLGKLFSVMKGKKSVLFDDSLKLNAIIVPFWIVESAKLIRTERFVSLGPL